MSGRTDVRGRTLAPASDIDPARTESLTQHLRGVDKHDVPGQGLSVHQAKWPPFENGKSPTILLATALGSKSDSNTKETKTTDNFLDAVRARIAKAQPTNDVFKFWEPIRKLFPKKINPPRILLAESIDMTDEQIKKVRSRVAGAAEKLVLVTMLLGLCPKGGNDFNSSTTPLLPNGQRKGPGPTEELVRLLQYNLNLLFVLLGLLRIVLCRNLVCDCNDDDWCYRDEHAQDPDGIYADAARMNSVLLAAAFAIIEQSGGKISGVVAFDPSAARSAVGTSPPYPPPPDEDYFVEHVRTPPQQFGVYQVLHPAAVLKIAHRDPLRTDANTTRGYNSGSIHDRNLTGVVFTVQAMLLTLGQDFWDALQQLLPTPLITDAKFFLNPSEKETRISVDMFVVVARHLVSACLTELMRSTLAIQPRDLPLEYYLMGYDQYATIDSMWARGHTLRANDGPRAAVAGSKKEYFKIQPNKESGARAILRNSHIFSLPHAPFIPNRPANAVSDMSRPLADIEMS